MCTCSRCCDEIEKNTIYRQNLYVFNINIFTYTRIRYYTYVFRRRFSIDRFALILNLNGTARTKRVKKKKKMNATNQTANFVL